MTALLPFSTSALTLVASLCPSVSFCSLGLLNLLFLPFQKPWFKSGEFKFGELGSQCWSMWILDWISFPTAPVAPSAVNSHHNSPRRGLRWVEMNFWCPQAASERSSTKPGIWNRSRSFQTTKPSWRAVEREVLAESIDLSFQTVSSLCHEESTKSHSNHFRYSTRLNSLCSRKYLVLTG